MKMTIFLWEFQYILIISSAVKARLGSLHDPNNCICKGISILVVNQWSGLVNAPLPRGLLGLKTLILHWFYKGS